ncbi:unnamed protein product [Moneuplotes crassus]|uniref:Uncharacterized protein n=1 Tax=Euplotes crassus TaxID=5936 RepID=A0AAD1Y248_EUPCR|nr:unnamed protein product [Moneuplotes crassus]
MLLTRNLRDIVQRVLGSQSLYDEEQPDLYKPLVNEKEEKEELQTTCSTLSSPLSTPVLFDSYLWSDRSLQYASTEEAEFEVDVSSSTAKKWLLGLIVANIVIYLIIGLLVAFSL